MKILCICGEDAALRHEVTQSLLKEAKRCRYTVAFWQKEPTGTKNMQELPADVVLHGKSIYRAEHNTLTDFLPYLREDLLLIEGAAEKLPTLLCCTNTSAAATLWNPYTIAAAVQTNDANEPAFPVFTMPAQLPALFDHIISHLPEALPFPEGNPCCGVCGKTDCPTFLAELLSGNATMADCALNQTPVQVVINGYSLPLVKFAQDIVEKTLRGLLSTLNGYEANSEIQITIKPH